ncbi:MAG: adenylate/guanylate cyclase domain-containing protein [Myxococcota bacterium]
MNALLLAALVGCALLVLWVWRLRAERAVLVRRVEKARADLGRLQQSFSRFTPADVVEDIIARGVAPRGDKREVTVLFADLQGFTSMSDKLDAEVMVKILNGYFEVMSQAIAAEHGHVAKFMGDGLMALFGAVVQNPWQARDAVRAALGMRAALVTYNAQLRAQGLPELKFGIGIHSGEVVAGMIGSTQLMEFTVIGDVVNVAARVESLTRQHQTDILVTPEVRARLDAGVRVREMPAVPVKGKPQPIVTYAVDGLGELTSSPA